jgi:hypothetical protein
MTADVATYDPLAFNNIAFSGIGIFGNLCSVGFYAMNGTAGFQYGYKGAVSKLSSIGNAASSGNINTLKSVANSCLVGGKGILYKVNSWGDAAHQWQYQIVVMPNNDIISSLALNENAILWKYTNPSLTYATASSAGKCIYTNANITGGLPPANTIVVLAPDSIAQVLSYNAQGGGEYLVPVSGPDMVNACSTSTSLLYAYNIIAPAQNLWGGTLCTPPSNPAAVCGTPPNFNPVTGTYQCFCTQMSNWWLVFDQAYKPNFPSYNFPAYSPIPAGQCT